MTEWFIREATADDAEAMIAHMKRIADEPDNGTTYDSSEQFTNTPDEEGRLIQEAHDAENALWLVAVTRDGKLIGETNCHGGKRARFGTVSFGIAVAKEWRSKGVGLALIQGLIDWGRANPVVHRLELEVIVTNARAIHVYEKLGFQPEGIRRESLKKHGKYLDSQIMAILFDA